MSSSQIVSNIINDICTLASPSLNVALKEPNILEILAAYTIRAVVLNPENEFNTNEEFTKVQVDKLIKLSVDSMVSNSIESESIKMQVYFDTIYPHKCLSCHAGLIPDDLLQKQKVDMQRKLNESKQIMIDFKGKTLPELDGAYRKLVAYLMRATKLGSETDLNDIRETTAVLESVFPLSEFKTFVGQQRSEKDILLTKWSHLVTGIRLFNKSLGKGGDNIEDIFASCTKEVDGLKDGITNLLNKSAVIIKTLESSIDKDPTSTQAQDFERIKAPIIYYRQLEFNIGFLKDDVESISAKCQERGVEFSDKMKELRSACKSRSAVPVDHIYPIFIAVSKVWDAWRDHLCMLQFYTQVLKTLSIITNNISKDEITYPAKEDIDEISEDVITKNALDIAAHLLPINQAVDVIHPGNLTQYKSIQSEYNGFCIYSLCEGNGLVLKGNKSLGCLRYQDKLYSFFSAKGFYAFANDPQHYIQGVIDIAKIHPSLIELLQLYSYFPTIEALENTKSFGRQKLLKQKKVTSECSTQSDVHIIESHIDPTYHWNEWDLRRKALEFVNLKNKLTHSTQTKLSHFKRDSETQSYPQKLNATQTRRDIAVRSEQIFNYMKHLRCDPDSKKKFEVETFKLS